MSEKDMYVTADDAEEKNEEREAIIDATPDTSIPSLLDLNDIPILDVQSVLPDMPDLIIPEFTNPLADSPVISALGEIALAMNDASHSILTPTIEAFSQISNTIVTNLVASLDSLISSGVFQQFQAVSTLIGDWLQNVQFEPLIEALEGLKDFGFDHSYSQVNKVYLQAMFDARWFPYAGWIADYTMVDSVFSVLDTSRASKNRTKRIDKLIFSYYNKHELNDLKRGWRNIGLPSYMTRILVQSVQAYHRKEYALTISALSTLWEGIIQGKVNDHEYRISRRTRENLSELIKENEFDGIFSSFCEEFIFYDCKKPEDVKKDVPGRHCIAHCWYDAYPTRKTALNAILFTDFLLRLDPIEKTEE